MASNLKTFRLTIESISAISLSSKRPHCFNNVILHLNEINKIKNAVVIQIVLVSLPHSATKEPSLSEHMRKLQKRVLIEVHENSGFKRKKKHSRMTHVNGN